jgi:DNA-binding winged helix-turn-helix (wHTH) protein/energy-coupling factor transporter ATP-binding protein EcfA2
MPRMRQELSPLALQVLSNLADQHCVAIAGLSNSGKSTLMRSLAGQAAEKIYYQASGHRGYLIYVDCNRAVAISAQAFYEVVLRAVLEHLADQVPPELANSLRGYYESVTEAETGFTASLSFNLALTDLCEQLDRNLCLLIDEFDEIYASLDERALLNLRALRDRFNQRLAIVIATLRSLPELRGEPFEDEFAEMFSRFMYNMPLFGEGEAKQFLNSLNQPSLKPKQLEICYSLSGGHPGLLVATAQVIAGSSQEWGDEAASVISREPQPRAECLKIWSQLTEDERSNLITLALEIDAGLPPLQLRHLEEMALLKQGNFFSPIFADFIMRKARGPEVATEGIYLDVDSGDVWVDGVRIAVLTDLEFRLLALLYERLDKLTDKYRIVTAVWGEKYLGEVDDARVEKLVSRLRSKIEVDPTDPQYLITLRGRGYKLLSTPRKK